MIIQHEIWDGIDKISIAIEKNTFWIYVHDAELLFLHSCIWRDGI